MVRPMLYDCQMVNQMNSDICGVNLENKEENDSSILDVMPDLDCMFETSIIVKIV